MLTSDIFPHDYGEKQIRFKSHNEIAYLHPTFFRPDYTFREKLSLKPDERYVILRFVAWNATHDKGHSGIKYDDKLALVDRLSKKYKVFISSEKQLPLELKKYQAPFSPHEMHNALYQAHMFIGEGTTMAMEAAILGTPSVYINTLHYNNVRDMEKYGLLYSFGQTNHLVEKISELADNENLKELFREKAMKLFEDKINLTTFLVWFVENYPQSAQIMNENPEYQFNFK
jgi:predicted glycosyltransferase